MAHLVTPYLFLTGSWIHTQLLHAQSTRPIVITQGAENTALFPFGAVHDLASSSRGLGRGAFLWSKYVRGHYPQGPYRNIMERESVRLIHAHLGWEGARTIGLARNPDRPFVVSFYGRDATLLARHPYWRALYRRLFRDADRVLAEGSFMAGTLRAIGAPPDRVRVVHLGVDPTLFPFAERSQPETAPIIGLISASFREKKGIAYGLDAFAKIAGRHPRARLRIIGDGPLRAPLERRANEADLRGRVDLLGYLPYPAYLSELAQAHFLLAPSVTARDGDSEGGAPVCLLEAQAMGVPVVGTTHCDIPEVTRPGESALLAPERDSSALADRLDALLSHPERWPEMGRAGRAHIETEFDIRKQVARAESVYREIL